MPRVKEEPRGRLAALQDMLSGGSQALLDQAQTLRDEVQRRLGDVGRGFEEQLGTVVGAVEERLSAQLDDLVSRVAVSIRKDLDRLRERVRTIETRLSDVPKEGVRELVSPLQALANNAIQTAGAVQERIEELVGRLQTVERRAVEVVREPAPQTPPPDDVRQHLDR
ncbi:MAG TPA: hypothetical protein VJT73_21690, partial [Polyangiaceae bacterium]|nr:hypothetical protein [Polyangiaceae bacterium]